MKSTKAYSGMRYRFSPFDLLVYGSMIFSLLICIIPFLYMLALSLSEVRAILNNQVGLWPTGFNTAAYATIFKYPNFFLAYRNTLLYTSCGTIIALTLTILFAYPLSKNFLRVNKFMLKLVVFSMFFSGGLIPTYLLISNLRLTNTPFAMLIPFAVTPFNLIILISFFRGVPHEIEEAALIDGMGYYGILFRIVLPLSTAALATIGLYYAVFFWNDWFNALIYLRSSQYPVMLFLRNIVNGTMMIGEGAGSAEGNSLGIAIKAAVIMVSTLPIIILYPL
ncbi:MAG: carbohydrate ABC transporter permease, partial [Treponema sp.]|nr:carbohydrate ABC transporter permease [Treponema sp.]